MRPWFIALATVPILAACDGEQPFTFSATSPDGTSTEEIDPRAPVESADNKYLYDLEKKMTMNSVEYDEDNDELIINNLPFDGPTQRYDHRRNLSGGAVTADLYDNLDRETATEAQINHYAVFVRTENLDMVAAMGGEWGDFGYGGANIRRSDFSMPNNGEFVYLGSYAGIRTFSDRGGVEIVSGDVRLLLDVNDFDPANGFQGAIVGTISNREVTSGSGAPRHGQPNVSLYLVEFNSTDGSFEDGQASTFFPDGSERSSGNFSGFLAGPDSSEIGAHVLIEGAAHFQVVQYEVVTYEVTGPDIVVPGIPGVTPDTVIPGTVTTGTYEALNSDNLDQVQNQVDAGITVGLITYNTADLPDGANVIEVEVESRDITSDFNAQELGVLGGVVVTP